MSTIQDVSAEQLAKAFHHYREALTHDCGGHGTEGEGSILGAHSPERAQIDGGGSPLDAARTGYCTSPQPEPGRKYYAKPGEAEWGC